MHVRKFSAEGNFIIAYEGIVVERTEQNITLHAWWESDDRDLGYTVFVRGDRFTEYYYAEHWFNIMRLDGGTDGALKGWYCNITRPSRITEDVVDYEDLALDLWVQPDGSWLVLDEDEFALLSLDEETRARAREGVAEVLRWVAQGLGPFAGLTGGIHGGVADIEG